MSKTVFLITEYGRAISTLMRTDVLPVLLEAGVRVVALVRNPEEEGLQREFASRGVVLERLRREKYTEYIQSSIALRFFEQVRSTTLARPISSATLRDITKRQVLAHGGGVRGRVYDGLTGAARWATAHSSLVRGQFMSLNSRLFTPNIHADLFAKYRPDMVVGTGPGYWPGDMLFMREARLHGAAVFALIVGWDNTASKGLPGAAVDYVAAWSEAQKRELVLGADLKPEIIFTTGVPAYDLLLKAKGATPRAEYFRRHGLDPERRLVAYACTLLPFSPNMQNITPLAEAIGQDRLGPPAQLLVRPHPAAYDKGFREKELEAIRQLSRTVPHVRLAELQSEGDAPRNLGAEGHRETAAFLEHSDVFVSIFSTMMVEAAMFDRPMVSACIDSTAGWPGRFSLPISAMLDWPTHTTIMKSGASHVVRSPEALIEAVGQALAAPQARAEARRKFAEAEVTYLDAQCGRRVAETILALLRQPPAAGGLGNGANRLRVA